MTEMIGFPTRQSTTKREKTISVTLSAKWGLQAQNLG